MTDTPIRTGDSNPGVSNEVIAQSPDMRFCIYTLQPGAQIPWHFHSQVNDWYVGREGEFAVETRAPDKRTTLYPGDLHQVPVRRIHRVVNTGDGTARFALVQGLGAYDFNPADR